MPADDAVAHRETEARSAYALRGEERFEAFPLGFFAHSDTGIGNMEPNPATRCARSKTKPSAVGHRADRVENQIREHFAQLCRHARDNRNVPKLFLDPDGGSRGVRLRSPTRHGEGERFF